MTTPNPLLPLLTLIERSCACVAVCAGAAEPATEAATAAVDALNDGCTCCAKERERERASALRRGASLLLFLIKIN